ncbi:hypothetical protein TNCV_3319651 [Trichonephila clavipes]|nr:hypothetical protein TNCV_3319651 [Trichonephila clavipes]
MREIETKSRQMDIKDLTFLSPTSQSSSIEHMKISRSPATLFSLNLDSSVESTEAHCCLVQETCSLCGNPPGFHPGHLD